MGGCPSHCLGRMAYCGRAFKRDDFHAAPQSGKHSGTSACFFWGGSIYFNFFFVVKAFMLQIFNQDPSA